MQCFPMHIKFEFVWSNIIFCQFSFWYQHESFIHSIKSHFLTDRIRLTTPLGLFHKNKGSTKGILYCGQITALEYSSLHPILIEFQSVLLIPRGFNTGRSSRGGSRHFSGRGICLIFRQYIGKVGSENCKKRYKLRPRYQGCLNYQGF